MAKICFITFVILISALTIECQQRCPEPNEQFIACPMTCDNYCETLYEQCEIFAPSVYIYTDCEESCYCMEGFARDDSGKCIKIETCPAKLSCRKE